MKLIKQVECGELQFKIGINKAIFAKTLEEFPEFSRVMFESQNALDKDSETSMMKLIETKTLSASLLIEEMLPSVVQFALPFMMTEGENENAPSPDVVIAYVEEHGVEDVFYTELFKFMTLAFTEGKQDKKPKVKFAIK